MAKSKTVLQFRRRREDRTNYRRRLAFLKSDSPRLTVRTSIKRIYLQIIEYSPKGDKILVACDSHKLKDYGWNLSVSNLPSAYLTGLLCGKIAKSKLNKSQLSRIIFDSGRGEISKGNIMYSALKGFADSGMNIPFSEDKLPSKERLSGTHIKNYALSLKNDSKKYNTYFSAYIKAGVKPEQIDVLFDQVKKKILEK